MLVNEFYSGLFMHANEYENLVHFKFENLYTFIDGQEWVITELDLGKLLGCEFFDGPLEVPSPYPVESIWDTLAREPGCKKIASNLKSLPLRFLHHFDNSVPNGVICKGNNWRCVATSNDYYRDQDQSCWVHYQENIEDSSWEGKGSFKQKKKTSLSLFSISYVTFITHYAKSAKIVQPKYEMVQIVVVYNLASIAKMGYKDPDNTGNFIKMRGDEGEDDEPAQASETHTLGQVMDVLVDL